MKVLDIYCGAGGLASGFKQAGFEVIGVDISKNAGRTFKFNELGSFIQADLSATPVDGNYDGIIGGPPCKPWSSVNLRRRGKNHKDYSLLLNYFDHIEHHLPAFFLLENVPPIASEPKYASGVSKLKNKGYSITGKTITYSDFGAAVRRRRFIAFGIRNRNSSIFFENLLEQRKKEKTVKDVIWDLRKKEKEKRKKKTR